MRKLIYSLGIASFLAMMIFTVATSLTNPFYGMSEAAIAQTTTTTSSTGSTGTGGDVECESSTYCQHGLKSGYDPIMKQKTCCYASCLCQGRAKT